MKNLIKLGTITLIAMSAMFAGCQKDIVTYNDGYDDGLTPLGSPKIDKVVLASDINADPAQITGASFTTMIAIKGSNLSQVQSVRFNDIEADLATVYAVNSEIIVPVPRVLPQNVDNLLVVTTSKGTASADFEVSIPDLQLIGLQNEFATAGDTVRIVGNNCDLYDVTEEKGEVKLNGRTLDILEASINELSVVIPEGTPDNSELLISGGKVESPLSCKFRDFGISMMIFEGLWGDWVPVTEGKNAGDPEPLNGISRFVRLVADLSAWDWDPGRIYGAGFGLSDQDIVDNPQNYSVKFEINTSKPISFGNIHIGSNASYQWNPAEGGISFNTQGEWRTMRFDLTTLGLNLTTSPAWNNLSLVYQPTAATSVDFSISNVRLVKK